MGCDAEAHEGCIIEGIRVLQVDVEAVMVGFYQVVGSGNWRKLDSGSSWR